MRGLCAASSLPGVQSEVCSRPLSLGSFSEAQALVDPQLLGCVFADLAAADRPELAGGESTGGRFAGLSGADRRVVAGTLQRGAAQSSSDGGNPVLSDVVVR